MDKLVGKAVDFMVLKAGHSRRQCCGWVETFALFTLYLFLLFIEYTRSKALSATRTL